MSYTWQLLDEHDVSHQQASQGALAHDQVTVAGTGVRPASPSSRTVYAAGQAVTAMAALEEAFDAAELRVLTTSRPFVLTAAGQELRVVPSPASDELSFALLAGLRQQLRAELQQVGR